MLQPVTTTEEKLFPFTSLNEYLGKDMEIVIDYSRDELFQEASLIQFKSGQYMLPTEKSPQEALARASIAYASSQGHAQRLYDYVSRHWFMFASPVLSSAGNERGCPISCFLSMVDDNREEISKAFQETLWLATEGGGVGADWSRVRSAGERTSRGTYTPGLIPFLKAVDSITLASIQGGVRRGATAVYIDISHPEIIEFINSRRATGGDANRKLTNIHNAVNIPDSFMKAVKEGTHWDLIDPHSKKVKKTVLARDLWRLILDVRMETGEPYMHFIDTSNKALPEFQKKLGLTINNSNLCVAPETLVLTSDGYLPIGPLKDKKVEIWNGLEWSDVTVRQTGQDKELVRVTFSDGSSIDCTPEHVFYTQNKYSGAPKKGSAAELVTGDKLEKFDLPLDLRNGGGHMAYAYDFGFYCGDGNKGYDISWIYEPKASVINGITKGNVSPLLDDNGRYRWNHGKFSYPDFFVPKGQEYSTQSKLAFLAGYLDADGCVISSDNCSNIQVVSTTYEFLKDISLMLQELGVHSSISFRREAGLYPMPLNDGSGENGLFDCQETWLLGIGGDGVARLLDLGIKFNRLVLAERQEPQRRCGRYVTVVSVQNTGRISDTFCFTEHKRNRGIFNGILTGNCSEIFLPTSPERTAVCCLSSVNLEYFDDWSLVEAFVPDVVDMLDNVLSVFVKKAPPFLSKAVYSAIHERSIGLGTMGFHLYLQKKGVPFEGVMASAHNKRIFRFIAEKAKEKTRLMATEKGEAPDAVGYGVRNSHLMAIAPNASSGILCNNTSPSIEPYNANVYLQITGNGSLIVKNRALDLLLMKKYNLYGKELEDIWNNILMNEGSVQHLQWMDALDRDVFKTAFELSQQWIIEHAADRQPFICQGQSVNLFLRPGVSATDVHKLHYSAWEKGLKSLYYCRSKNIGKAAHTTVETTNFDTSPAGCLSCEG